MGWGCLAGGCLSGGICPGEGVCEGGVCPGVSVQEGSPPRRVFAKVGVYHTPLRWSLKREVRILLECILVGINISLTFKIGF